MPCRHVDGSTNVSTACCASVWDGLCTYLGDDPALTDRLLADSAPVEARCVREHSQHLPPKTDKHAQARLVSASVSVSDAQQLNRTRTTTRKTALDGGWTGVDSTHRYQRQKPPPRTTRVGIFWRYASGLQAGVRRDYKQVCASAPCRQDYRVAVPTVQFHPGGRLLCSTRMEVSRLQAGGSRFFCVVIAAIRLLAPRFKPVTW